jgi:predicted O-methyltransferase YrrM
MSLTGLSTYFKNNNIKVTEGYSEEVTQQCLDIKQILKDNLPTKIMEIGFNAGHSTELFLKNSDAYVYSFDLGDHFHQYLKYGKQYINKNYPDRHTLILGDSTIRVPIFAQNNDIKFDLIFIDGGHSYEVAYADLINCRKLANENTIIIMDDIIKKTEFQEGHTIGPSNAWNKLIQNNLLSEISHSDYSKGRGQSVGKYIF